jgi:hypothetical protein
MFVIFFNLLLLYIAMVEGNGDGNKLHVSFSKNDEINTLLGNQGTSLGLEVASHLEDVVTWQTLVVQLQSQYKKLIYPPQNNKL